MLCRTAISYYLQFDAQVNLLTVVACLVVAHKDYRDWSVERKVITLVYNQENHHRRSLRLKGYDYRQVGAYFVNIVLQNRLCLFGEIIGMEMQLNQAGEMVSEVWEALPNRFPAIAIDTFVVMPNHLHGIIIINQHPVPVVSGLVPSQNVGAQNVPAIRGYPTRLGRRNWCL